MLKLTWKVFMIMPATISLSMSVFLEMNIKNLAGAIAQNSLKENPKYLNNKSALNWFRDLFKRIGKDTSNRGEFCSIFPNSNLPSMLNIWTTKPKFIWMATDKVKIEKIEVINFKSNSIVWEHQVTENEQKQQLVNYIGSPLEEGDYSYRLHYKLIDNPLILAIDFNVIDPEKRNQLNSNLPQITPAESSEKLAQRRADYFAERGFLADAIQEIFAVNNPSDEWKKGQQELRDWFCNINF